MNLRALFLLGAILLSACSSVTPTPSVALPPVVWIPEMQAFNEDFSSKASPTNLETESFQAQWQVMRDPVATQVSTDTLVRISHWAQEQTKGTILPKDWIASVPMNPIGATKDGKRLLFSQSTEQGVSLPVHAPIVFRHLIVGAAYDRDAQSISKIYITIRGWREE
jgi:hypothetical protein